MATEKQMIGGGLGVLPVTPVKCVMCNGSGSRYARHETGYVSMATETCADCSGSGRAKP